MIRHTEKPCTKCGVVKSYEEFYRRSAARDGYASSCKKCMRDCAVLVRDKRREYRHRYYEMNRTKSHADSRSWALRNMEKMRSYARRSYRKHRDVHLLATKRWRTNNPEKARLIYVRRRAVESKAKGSYMLEDWIARVVMFKGKCAYCSRYVVRLTVDHVVPLSKGGSNNISNIVPACSECNQRKKDKVWMPCPVF